MRLLYACAFFSDIHIVHNYKRKQMYPKISPFPKSNGLVKMQTVLICKGENSIANAISGPNEA